jgi:hypothetical protein
MPANLPFTASFSPVFLGVVRFRDAVGKSNNKILSYQKLIGKGISKQTLDTVSTKFEEKALNRISLICLISWILLMHR